MGVPVVICRLCAVAVVFASLARGQDASKKRYAISVGVEAEKIASGALWIYSYSRMELRHYKLAAIEKGAAVIPFDTERLKSEVEQPGTDTYVLVLQAGEHLWYRTPDIAPEDFWAALPASLDSLGRTATLATGETQLVLPAPTQHRITLLSPDGKPRAHQEVPVSVYLWDDNHCHVHEGLPMGTFTTDASGTLVIPAPRAPLYLKVRHYPREDTDQGVAEYSLALGMELDEDETQVIEEQWDPPNEFEAELTVLTTRGKPRANAWIHGEWRAETCAFGEAGKTDSRGVARFKLDSTIYALAVFKNNRSDKGRELTDDELRELLTKHKLTIRW